ncbi:FecR family protein [Pedobacter alluvionis]|uniref:FecR family protein n=1 Tax=Pedobacter alluvionis TaxID=475253 RepID=A0A497Y0K9_9SPHI|nr:FecR family protein [Pedobacter alluvionis]RLJ75125.1 FecR family protein [Pedobacter alluvionis]TFB30229.1 FecR family protein [Pedobacter alluvionis]
MEQKQPRLQPPTPQEKQLMWENIIKEIEIRERRKRLVRVISIAATVIILSVGGMVGYSTISKPDIYFAQSGTENVLLRDGSRVTLSRGAKLTVEKSFPADTRDVFLEGDAVFNVAKSKDHPFIVHGKGYETKVLGTVFKISQYGNTFKVDLYEGKVLVYKPHHSKETIALKPKQTFTNFGIPEVTSVMETENINIVPPNEKLASLTFKACPIKDAFQIIEKTYGVSIHYPADLENTKITTSVSDTTADIAVHMLAFQLNLKFKHINDSLFELEK